jgi:hypothetical protein
MQCIYKKNSYRIGSTVVYLVGQQSVCGRGFDIHDEIGLSSHFLSMREFATYVSLVLRGPQYQRYAKPKFLHVKLMCVNYEVNYAISEYWVAHGCSYRAPIVIALFCMITYVSPCRK